MKTTIVIARYRQSSGSIERHIFTETHAVSYNAKTYPKHLTTCMSFPPGVALRLCLLILH